MRSSRVVVSMGRVRTNDVDLFGYGVSATYVFGRRASYSSVADLRRTVGRVRLGTYSVVTGGCFGDLYLIVEYPRHQGSL